MEPTATPKLTPADVQHLAEQLLPLLPPPAPSFIAAVGWQKAPPPPSVQAIIDGAPEFPAAAFEAVQQQLQEDDNAWLTRYLVEALVLAGEPATVATLPEYAGRLCLRRHPDGVVVVAIDAQPATEHQPATRGLVLFGFGEPEVNLQHGLAITRPILSARQALAYEVSAGLRALKQDDSD